MTSSPKDLKMIESSRDINHVRLIIADDLSRLSQLMADKKMQNIRTECIFTNTGAVTIMLYASYPINAFGKEGSYKFANSTNSYDEAYEIARKAIYDANGDVSNACAPWFDMKVYETKLNP